MAGADEDLETAAFVRLLRTAEHLNAGLARLLKSAGLSPTQYNVLRILRGAGERGLTCNGIGARMIAHDPDITRLLDRLEARALVTRERDPGDRRALIVRIAPEGLALLAPLDQAVAGLHREQFGHLDRRRLRELLDTLEDVRGRG